MPYVFEVSFYCVRTKAQETRYVVNISRLAIQFHYSAFAVAKRSVELGLTYHLVSGTFATKRAINPFYMKHAIINIKTQCVEIPKVALDKPTHTQVFEVWKITFALIIRFR